MSKAFTFATVDQVREIKEKGQGNYYHDPKPPYFVEGADNPWGYSDDQLHAALGFPASYNVKAGHYSRHASNYYYKTTYGSTKKEPHAAYDSLREMPFFVTAAWTKNIKVRSNPALAALAATSESVDFLYRQESYHPELINQNIVISVEHKGVRFLLTMPVEAAEGGFGLTVTDDMKMRLNRSDKLVENDIYRWNRLLDHLVYYTGGRYDDDAGFNFTLETVNAIKSRVNFNNANMANFIRGLVRSGYSPVALEKSGIAKTWNKLEPVLADLLQSDPISFCAFRSFVVASKRSIDGVKVSAIFNEVFKDASTKEDISQALKDFYSEAKDDEIKEINIYANRHEFDECVKNMPLYKEKRKLVLKSQANRAFTKLQEDAENLTIDKDKHKLTWAAIESGKLAIGTFFRKKEQYFLLNDNWDLWEEMFRQGHGDIACELADEVKGRTTYEKDLMSYFYCVLYGLPEYLKKHTGCKWTCIPKLVNTQDELEPPKEEGGVARKRSALTPVANNETKEVVIPYASLAIGGGFGTTYCYSHDYHVLTRGFSFNGNAVTNDIEKKLNGRDDYGLMFYTLTGSAQGRGYPTFLIIFERRASKGDTRVHFHRTHPSRSKDGDYNSINNWIKVCYNWMAGNIKQNRIKAQQGDLAFVQVKTDESGEELDGSVLKNLDFSHKVNQYDSHCFEEAVPFAEYTKAAKSNILGYVKLEKDTWLRHTEHDDVLIPEGTYAIHQCRSWEANPQGVWSLRID